jgi:hypothetical protein
MVERSEPIDPEIRAKMEMWDLRSGRTSSRMLHGPLSEEHRANIGAAVREQAAQQRIKAKEWVLKRKAADL